MPHSTYALRRDEDGTWAVIDPAGGAPVIVRDRRLSGLDKHEAYDAIRLLALIETLRPRGAPEEETGEGTA